ncbi:MAG: hypothetical protein HKP27_03865 [Myxococcales bacterium]|nr:hypothetical protein [Myxococcales bacterium]
MEREEVLACLLALAREQGIAVHQQDALRRGERDLLPRSGLCRVRGEQWLVILDHDSLEDRIAAAAEGLSKVAGEALEGRYLPPAVRRELGE